MPLPTFLIIGAGKAGTTSLHYYLDMHPQIQMSAIKEPNFFAGPENGKPYPMGRVDRLEDYEQLFNPAIPARGEASPNYTSHPLRQGVPQRIKQMIPNAKLIYVVRDPVARTVSHHQHLVAVGEERRTLGEVLSDLSEPSCLPETCYSLYAYQLEQYLRHFPQEQILVVDQAELRSARRATLSQLFSFLSVDDTFDSPAFDEELYRSSDRRTYPPGYERLIVRTVAPALRWIPPTVRRPVRSRLERLVFSAVESPALDDELRARLQELYAEEVQRLRALTGMDFSSWSV
jgi:hypothetical protein